MVIQGGGESPFSRIPFCCAGRNSVSCPAQPRLLHHRHELSRQSITEAVPWGASLPGRHVMSSGLASPTMKSKGVCSEIVQIRTLTAAVKAFDAASDNIRQNYRDGRRRR